MGALSGGPGGTLTVLFTDLVGSTELMQRLGDEHADRVRRAHFRALRDAVAARGGLEVKSVGDGLMVVFSSALDAVACAVAMQQSVYAHNQRGEGPPLGVRVGLDVGEPIREEADYFGTPVVIAKRLCDSAQGGQIIVSELVRRLTVERAAVALRDLEPLRLKGIAEPLSVCEVVWEPAAAAPASIVSEDESLGLLAEGEAAVFVGRGHELEELRRFWKDAGAGQRQLVLLTGEPGIGKTRLAAEFAREAVASGAEPFVGRAERSAGFAHQPLITSALSASKLPKSVVLLLDDLQWADAATLEQLARAVRRRQESPLLIIATYREADVTPKQAVAELVADLRRERLVRRIPVTGLVEAEVATLVGSWAGQHAPAELARMIHARTEGNPFFVEEMLRDLAETGAMYDEDGRLRGHLSQTGIPQGAKEMIMRRLSRLSEPCNSVLTIASVIGREFGMDALARASGLPDEQLLAALEEAVRATVIQEAPHVPGRYSFAHALIYEALYDELTTTRRVHLHGQTLQYADNDGVKLAYEVLGATGPHVIVIGLSNCPAVRTRNRTTAMRWDRLTARCRLILYDRRGVAFSSAPERGYGLSASIEDVRAVLDAAGVERAILWGAADGGPLAIAFAAHQPERVAGLLLTGTTANCVSSDDFPFGISAPTLESFLRIDAVDRGRALSQLSSTRLAAAGDAISDVMGRVPRPVWAKVVGSIGAADARSLLPQVRAPTLIIHDPDNDYIPVGAARYLHEHIQGSQLMITEEYGSLLFGESVYARMEAFIEEVLCPNGS